MDTNINIIFSNQQVGGSESDPEVPGATPNPEAPEQTKKGGKESNKSLTVAKALGVAIAKQSISIVTSRVGAVTRSTVKQQQVNAAMKMGGFAIGLGVAAATQNWAAAGMMLVSESINIISESVDYNHKKGIEQTTLSVMQARAGINRSR